MTIKADSSLEETWVAIVQGLAASGELSPEKLQEKNGPERIKVLATHAAYLAKNFHNAYRKVNA